MSKWLSCLVLLAVFTQLSGWANDSSAMLKGGGLVLTQSNDISMESEDLYISKEKVRVNYVFKNNSAKDIETLVAFPLPKVDTQEMSERDVDVDHENPNNFVDFRIRVEGKAIAPQGKLKAFVGKTDVTRDLEALKIPLNSFDRKLFDRLHALSSAEQKRLADKQIVSGSGNEIFPLWVFEATYFWKQKFPAGKTVRISHEYRPVVGHSFFMTNQLPESKKPYCIDAGTEKGIRSMMKKEEDYLKIHEIEYVLKTGANWKGPIKNFKLTVDKGNPKAIVSLCEPNIQKVGPTTFQVSYKNYVPKSDLKILILENLEQ